MRSRTFLWAAVAAACGLLTTYEIGSMLLAAGAEKPAPRACRSIHLGYDAPAGTAFYNEVTVERSVSGTYFCVCGFSKGYYGIQELGNGKKVVIFSIWDPPHGDNPKAVQEERRVKLLYKDPEVRTGRFGGEGTGGQSFLDYDWQIGKTYRCLVTCRPDGERAVFTAYFWPDGAKEWRKLASFSTLSRGKHLGGYYSFIEDFRRDGVSFTQARQARYGHGWVRTAEGTWTPIRRAQFTGDGTQVFNINAGLAGGEFFLVTGGETKNTQTRLNQWMELPARPTSQPVSQPAAVLAAPREE